MTTDRRLTRTEDNAALREAEAWIERERFHMRDEAIAIAAFGVFLVLLLVTLHFGLMHIT